MEIIPSAFLLYYASLLIGLFVYPCTLCIIYSNDSGRKIVPKLAFVNKII
jgi:hypothetical protein